MRKFLLLFFLFYSPKSFPQKFSLENLVNIISRDVCKCFSNKNVLKTFESKNWDNCFSSVMNSNKKLLIGTAQYLYGDTSYATGEELGYELHQLVSAKLVYECDKFYNALLEDRKVFIQKHNNLSKDSIRKVIEKQNSVLAKFRNADYYNIRGGTYFELNDFDSAIRDLDSAEILDKHSIIDDFYKSQIAELKGSYDEAIKYYETFAKESNMFLFQLYANMLRRMKITK